VGDLQCERGKNYIETIENRIEEGFHTSKEVNMGRNYNEYHEGQHEEHHKGHHEGNHEGRHEEHHEGHHGSHHEGHHEGQHEEHHKEHHEDNHEGRHEGHHEGHHERQHGSHHEGHHGEQLSGHHKVHHEEYREGHNGYGFGELEAGQESELLTLIARAGHFMHHKRGGMRGQEKILTILAENEEISQKDLQEQLGIQSGSMSEIVIKLESKGFLDRVKDDADKRMTKLRLTDLGREKREEINQRSDVDQSQLLQSLSEEEQEVLKGLLSKLISSWEESFATVRVSKCGHGHWEDGMHRGHKGCKAHHGMHHGRIKY
jgi:DNA-binding MarR family transcriptional regulator